jgi:predicted methyltransferase
MRSLLLLLLSCGCAGSPAAQEDPSARAAFDRYRRPDELIAALAIAPGARIADVGAGAGYLTARLAAQAGPTGRVVATDLEASALARIPRTAGAAPIETRVVRPEDPGLEPGAYDLILLSEVDHLLADRAAYFQRLRQALARGGRLAVANRRLYRAPLVEAAGRAGLVLASEHRGLPAHFLVVLTAERPERPEKEVPR